MVKEMNIKLNQKVLKSQQVGLALVFGSQIIGSKHSKSDIDIGIVFLNNKRKQKPVDVYGTLHEEFVKKFKTENIDIVYLEDSPLSLQYKAVRDGVVLYEISPSFFADYKEKVLKMYFDFKFIEDIFNQAIIKPA
ncbi:MAG: nucleotidyltransferase domain-containing protein [Candidatus Portnoybacteria bacterium]|nr:nucleotidyltransferase domain-containing protein [Candidatus Portnoybacteria bacterium]